MKWIKYILLIGCFTLLCQTSFAQWGFTATFKTSGNCYGVNLNLPLPCTDCAATKAECEAIRQQVLNSGRRIDGCNMYFTCTPCTGKDIATTDPFQGYNTNNGFRTNNSWLTQGQAPVTQNPTTDVEDWGITRKLYNEAFAPESNQSTLATAQMGGASGADDEYQKAVQKSLVSQSARKDDFGTKSQENQEKSKESNLQQEYEELPTLSTHKDNGDIWMLGGSQPKWDGFSEEIKITPQPPRPTSTSESDNKQSQEEMKKKMNDTKNEIYDEAKQTLTDKALEKLSEYKDEVVDGFLGLFGTSKRTNENLKYMMNDVTEFNKGIIANATNLIKGDWTMERANDYLRNWSNSAEKFQDKTFKQASQ